MNKVDSRQEQTDREMGILRRKKQKEMLEIKTTEAN
jgi:hypothetical protein